MYQDVHPVKILSYYVAACVEFIICTCQIISFFFLQKATNVSAPLVSLGTSPTLVVSQYHYRQ